MATATPPTACCSSARGEIVLLRSCGVVLGWPRPISAATAGVPPVSHGRWAWRRRGASSLLGAVPGRAVSSPGLIVAAKAVDSTQPSASASASAASDGAVVSDNEFSLGKVSFGVIGLAVGCTLLSYGFGAYFSILPGSEWSALMLTYGFPLAIIGMALKYAELKPVTCITYSDAKALRERCATPILKQVKNDVTRYRYGDEQHLDEALKRIFQYGQGGGIPRRSAPTLKLIREEVTGDGKYCLVLVFEAKALQLTDFEQRQAKFSSFFGPGVTAEIGGGDDILYEVRLISNMEA